jgi:hypothetical protein
MMGTINKYKEQAMVGLYKFNPVDLTRSLNAPG